MPNSGQMFPILLAFTGYKLGREEYGCKQFHSKVRKNKHRKEVETLPAVHFLIKTTTKRSTYEHRTNQCSHLKYLNGVNTVNKWPLHVELTWQLSPEAVVTWNYPNKKHLPNTTDKSVPLWGYHGDSCSSWKSCPFMGAKQFHSKVRKNKQ